MSYARREEPDAFAPLAAALASDLHIAIAQFSREPERKVVSRAEVLLSPKFTTAQSFKVIALCCLQHWALNRDAVIAGDPEGVHQMRVGLRRMRAALSIFKGMTDDRETKRLKGELKWLTEQLAGARDTSVFLDDTLKPHRHTYVRGLTALEGHVEDLRKEGLEKARTAVESARFRELVLRTFLWVLAGPWTHREAANAAQSPRSFARHALTKRTKKIVKKTAKVEKLDEVRRHKLRIAIKKLRYASDFFDELFPGRKSARKRFAKILKELQDDLGELNDIRTHRDYSEKLLQPREAHAATLNEAFALGYVAGEEHSDIPALLAATRKSGRRLSSARPFWN